MENLDDGRFQTVPKGIKKAGQPKADGPLKDFRDIILQRRATIHFEPDPIPKETVEAIIDLTLQAPSGYNLQPWRFIVVQEELSRLKLSKAAFNQKKITEAPVVIIAIGMKEEWKRNLHAIFLEGVKRGAGKMEGLEKAEEGAVKFLSRQNMETWVTRHTMIAVTYLMLAAESFGFNTAPMEGFDSEKVKEYFSIPDEGEVVALLAIGKAKPPLKTYPGRLSRPETVFSENFGTRWKNSKLSLL